jgi:nitrate/TMAO reductase-like tetraheme cytochrome c subunit
MESSAAHNNIYYTQQAIVIGCSFGDEQSSSKALMDARRVRNFLKTNYSYECRLLENPDEVQVMQAIQEAREMMNYHKRNSRLLIYFSGEALRAPSPSDSGVSDL